MSKIYVIENIGVGTGASPSVLTSASIHADYLGNIYIKYNDVYYIIILDNSVQYGIELVQIKNQTRFRQNLIDMQHLKTEIKSGVIKSGLDTLRGRLQSLVSGTDVPQDTKTSEDIEYYENKFFWTQYADDNESDDDIPNDNFYLNGVVDDTGDQKSGIVFSDLSCTTRGSFNTILVDGDLISNNVVSSIERIDGHYTACLTIYSSGYFRINFIDHSKLVRLAYNDGLTFITQSTNHTN